MQNSPLVHIALYKATGVDLNNQENKNSDYDNYTSCCFQFFIVVVK